MLGRSGRRTRALLAVGIALSALLATTATAGGFRFSAATPECPDWVGDVGPTVWWDGPATGPWNVATSWSTNALPGPTDLVCIPAGNTVSIPIVTTASINALQSFGTLQLPGFSGHLELLGPNESTATVLDQTLGTLKGAGTLRITGAATWTGGTQSGTGQTVIDGTLTRSGSATTTLSGRKLTIAGTANVSGPGANPGLITMKLGAKIEVLSGGTFDFQSDGQMLGDSFDALPERFANDGTVTKSAGTSAIGTVMNSSIQVVSTGAVTSSVGTLKLFGADGDAAAEWAGAQSGSFGGTDDGLAGTDPGLVEFALTGSDPIVWDLADGTAFDGAVKLSGGTLAIPDGVTVPVTADATMTQSGLQAIIEGAGTLAVDGAFDWIQGKQQGTGTTLVGGTFLKTTAAQAFLSGRTLTISGGGIARVIGAANQQVITMQTGATIKTVAPDGALPGGTFEFQSDSTIGGAAAGRFLNEGTLTKTGGTSALGGGSRIGVELVNTGAVTSSVGSLLLMGGDGTAGTGWAGAQSGRFGGTEDGDGATDPGVVVFGGGLFDLGDGTEFDGTVEIRGGTLSILDGVTVPTGVGTTTTETGGGIAGAGTFEVNGSLLWDTGSQGIFDASAPGVLTGLTVIRPGAFLIRSSGNHPQLIQRTLRVEGSLIVGDDSSGPTLAHAARLEVEPGGVIDFQGDALLDYVPSSPDPNPLVVNEGTIKKSQGTNVASGVVAPLDNQGVLLVEAGAGMMVTGFRLQNYDAFTTTLTGGTYDVKDKLLIGRPPSAAEGRVRMNAAHVILDGPTAELWYNAEVFSGSAADALAQLHTNAAGGWLELKNGKALSVPALATNAGRITLDATSSLSTLAGALTTTSTGIVEGTGTLYAPATNNGTFSPGLSAGTLHVEGSYTMGASGSLAIEIGAAAHDRLEVNGPITLGGTLAVSALPGYTPAVGDTFEIATGTSVSGAFANVVGAPVGLSYAVSTTSTSVVLTVAGALAIPNTLVAGPSGTWVRPTATHTLSSDPAGASFECRVNGGAWTSCTSPRTTSLVLGRQVLDFRAVNGGGTDASPESRELRVVRPFVADWDANGKANVNVWRPSSGGWLVSGSPNAFFGRNGDVPVPGQWDADPAVDRAVWRPVSGGWYVEGSPTVYFGAANDVPVAADWDGNGDLDAAVWRPVSGGWYVSGAATSYFGRSGDVPVPGDYDADPQLDRAVFRPSNGAWFVEGSSTVFHGQQGDVPIPADWNGDGKTDIAVFRPSNSTWYLRGISTTAFGAAGDVPLAGDFDADAAVDKVLFRPTSGAWYVDTAVPFAFFGVATDIP